MTLASVRADLAQRAPDLEVRESAGSTATVALAAAAIGVTPGEIAKTLALGLNAPLLLVARGDARLDNAKFRAAFGQKPRMLDAAAAEALTSHPVGGVCPFGLPAPVRIVCDVSLRAYDHVLPAAGAPNSWVRLTPDRLAELTGADWVDVMRLPD